VVIGTDAPGRVADVVGTRSGTTDLEVDGPVVRFRTPDGARALPGLLRELDAGALAMTSVEVRRPSLDDVFLTLTGRTLRDAEQAEPTPAGVTG